MTVPQDYIDEINLNQKPLIVNKPSDLTDYLKKQAVKHEEYHHYTNLEGLEKILETKSFKMTKGVSCRLNDFHEPENKGDLFDWQRTFITCFNYSEEENMAMWGLYGKPKTDAICISISNKTFNSLVSQDEYIFFYKSGKNFKEIEDKNINLFATDIFYAKGNSNENKLEKQTHYDTKIKNNIKIDFNILKNEKNENGTLFKHLKQKEYTGFVKNYAWHYEDEVRIITNNYSNNEILKKEESIYFSIPEGLINSFKITTGPNFTKFRELNDLLRHYEDYKLEYNKSVLWSKVNLKDFYSDIGEAIVDVYDKIKMAIRK